MKSLEVKNLHVSVEDKEILKGVNLSLKEGEILALLGPNGHGKSTLLAAIMGNPRYQVTSGSIKIDDKEITSLEVDERSKEGIFLAFQNPSEIPGVVAADFYKAAMNVRRDKKLKLFEFYRSLEGASKEVNLPFDMVNRHLNDGFSGGEKKRNEIFQMILLNPTFSMLDEIDSGLDVDSIYTVSDCIKKQNEEKNTGFLVISHYARLFNLIKPTRAAVIVNGRIVCEGGPELIDKIDKEGYKWIEEEYGVSIEKEEDKPMNKVSIGVCATKEAIK